MVPGEFEGVGRLVLGAEGGTSTFPEGAFAEGVATWIRQKTPYSGFDSFFILLCAPLYNTR